MKKYALQLQKLADKFQKKYAQEQMSEHDRKIVDELDRSRSMVEQGFLHRNPALQGIIENAASWGEQSVNGIMNYPTQLTQDKANLALDITIKSGLMGGRSAEVTNLRVDPAQFASKYSKLPEQIKKYLDKHLGSFPQITEGQFTIEYKGNKGNEVAAN